MPFLHLLTLRNIFIWRDALLRHVIAIQKLSVFHLELFSKACEILQCKK